jgi:BRCA1-like protein
MFRARERGMSFWPFVVSLLVLAVFVLMWFSVSGERDNAKRDAQAQKERADRLEAERKADIQKFQEASSQVGFLAGGNTTDAATVKAQMDEYGKKIQEQAVVEYATNRYTADPNGPPTKVEGDKIKVYYLTEGELQDTPTVQSWLSKFETALTRMKADIIRAEAERGQALEAKDAAAKQYEDNLKEKDARIATVTQEKQAADNAAHEKEAELNDKIANLTRDKEKAEQEKAEVQKTASENEGKLVAQISEAKSTIHTLTQREAPVVSEGPDGEVVIASEGIAIVNRGKTHFLMPGTVFKVFGRAKGGNLYEKGSIKVISTDTDTSRATVLEETRANDPIQKGDLVQSLTYSPNRKLHFYLVGEFKRMGRTQIEAQLARLGAVVDSKVTAETNYVVLGTGENLEESEPVKAAKDLGIRTITEEQLASFTKL